MFYNHKVRIKNGVAIHPLEWILGSKFLLKQEITWDMGKSANCDKIRFFPFSERIYWLTKNPKTKLHNNLNLSDVWRIVPTHKRKETGHIAVMPEEVVSNILESIDAKIIFDPFVGSGTTCVVAVKHNKKFIGFELNKEYIEKANTRLDNLEINN
jgi:modification methylase